MRKFLLGLLLHAGVASAQIGNFPALIGQRGTTVPTNCAIGQLFFDTDATAGSNIYGCTAANTWTLMGSGAGTVVADLVTATCTVATAVLYNSATPCSANLTYSATMMNGGPGIRVGTTGTSAGWYFGYGGFSDISTLHAGGVTPTTTNYSVLGQSGYTIINAPNSSGVDYIYFATAATTRAQVGGPAGTGLAIIAGTAASNAPRALSISQTWTDGTTSNIGIVGNFDMGATGTATGKLLSLQAGAAGTTEVFAVDYLGVADASALKRGGVVTISGTAPTYASGGCLTGAGTVVTNSNGTATVTVTNGTGCAASQPIVLTYPAATIGWKCSARNVSNAAISSPAQTGAVSTTSVTITNYSRTLGTAAAWTDSDVIVVSCIGG